LSPQRSDHSRMTASHLRWKAASLSPVCSVLPLPHPRLQPHSHSSLALAVGSYAGPPLARYTISGMSCAASASARSATRSRREHLLGRMPTIRSEVSLGEQ